MTVTTAQEAPERRRRRLPVGVEVILAVIVVALVQGFVAKPFGVPSQSMEQTLRIGDRIVVDRTDSTVERGDIVRDGGAHISGWTETTPQRCA